MNHWQDITVVCLIAGAVIYLARTLWCRLTRRAGAACDSCPGCSSNSGMKNQPAESLPLHDLRDGSPK